MLQRAPKLGRFVNPAWKKFRDFLLDMGPKPEPKRKYELDRIDNTDPEYGPGKCRWANDRVQNNNKSDTLVFVSVDGKKFTASELAKRQGVKVSAIQKRRSRSGWTHDEIIEGARRAPFLQVSTPTSTPATPSVPNSLPTAAKPAKTAKDKLADFWEVTMRELKPEATAPLTGKERGRLASFGEYLDKSDLHSDKTSILEFILRDWYRVCSYVCNEIGRFRGPASPNTVFLAEHSRDFVNYVKIAYKPEDISKLQFTNDDKPTLPETKPISGLQINKKPPKGEKAPLEEIMASARSPMNSIFPCEPGNVCTQVQIGRRLPSLFRELAGSLFLGHRRTPWLGAAMSPPVGILLVNRPAMGLGGPHRGQVA